MAERFSEMFEALLLQLGQHPKNFGSLLEQATHRADGMSPLSGDRISVELAIAEDTDKIEVIKFCGQASALTYSSASIMTDGLIGMTTTEALRRIDMTLERIKGKMPVDVADSESYNLLMEISEFPHRMACASLPWKVAAIALGARQSET